MKNWMLALAVALMAACGSPDPVGQNDSSVTPSPDSGTPAPDVGQPDSSTPMVDAAVGNDVPVVPTDSPSPEDVQRDADMVIAGVGPMITTGPFRCGPQLCRDQVVTGSTEPRRVTCNSGVTEANLTSLGFTSGDGWATCRGNSCFMRMGESMQRAIVYPMTAEGFCQPCGTIVDIDTSTGMELPRGTSGPRQSCGI